MIKSRHASHQGLWDCDGSATLHGWVIVSQIQFGLYKTVELLDTLFSSPQTQLKPIPVVNKG